MPTISAHGNANVSKIWVVVLVAFVAITSVTWKLYLGIQDLAQQRLDAQSRINELLGEY